MGYSRQVVSLIDFEKAAGGYQGEEDRLRLFDRLAGMGYKEISIGSPAASAEDYQFCRSLAQRGVFPAGVTLRIDLPCGAGTLMQTQEAIEGLQGVVVCLTDIPDEGLAACLEQAAAGSGQTMKPESGRNRETMQDENPAAPGRQEQSAMPGRQGQSAAQDRQEQSAMPGRQGQSAAQDRQEQPAAPVSVRPEETAETGFVHTAKILWSGSRFGMYEASRVLRTEYGLSIPEQMQEELETAVAGEARRISGLPAGSDAEKQKEGRQAHRGEKLTEAGRIYRIFEDHYVNPRPVFQVHECHFRQENGIIVQVTISDGEKSQTVIGEGNGRLDAVSNAIKNYFNISYELSFYEEHSLTRGSSSKAVAYVGIVCHEKRYWGAGINNDVIQASVEALEVAVNKIEELQGIPTIRDKRAVEIINFIQENYVDVTLESLSERFFLSKPYLSKYIREKSGMTFGEQVKKVRMKKARTLLKSSAMTVESIALSVGYQNVEHFNRLFKKSYHMTPVQFRNQF